MSSWRILLSLFAEKIVAIALDEVHCLVKFSDINNVNLCLLRGRALYISRVIWSAREN